MSMLIDISPAVCDVTVGLRPAMTHLLSDHHAWLHMPKNSIKVSVRQKV